MSTKSEKSPARKSIQIWGIKQNNLKNIDIEIPLGSFTVICGPSGSGKSSLAFETLYAEGQRRYIESLNNYARQFLGKAPKPDIEGINNIPPAIAIEQKNSVKTSRSSVGTTTEVIDYLRLLFEKIGRAYCPTYGFGIEKDSVTTATKKALASFIDLRGYVLTPVYSSGRSLSTQQIHKMILQEGFTRIYIPNLDSKSEASKTSAASTKKKAKKIRATKMSAAEAQKSALLSSAAPICKDPDQIELMGRILDVTPKSVKDLPDTDFFIVIDRMQFSKDEEGRLADSLGIAYRSALKFNPQLTSGRARVLTTDGKRANYSEENSCSTCGFNFPSITSSLFSFNNPIGACQTCNGFGNILTLDEHKIIPNDSFTISEGALHPFTMPSAASDRRVLHAFCKKAGIDLHTPWRDLPKAQRDSIWKGDDKFFGVVGLFEYLETKKYKMHIRVFLSRYKSPFTCLKCKGTRLRSESEYIKVAGRSISELSALTIGELHQFLQRLELTPMQKEMAEDILVQLVARLGFLSEVGCEYLTIDRATRTLSGGEYQRLSLAKQLGMGLSQTLYVLDEPTVGLHPRDNDRLIGILKKLNNIGNTLVVVEHDHDVISNSTHIIELGPGSGHRGGEVIYAGNTEGFYSATNSNTASYLKRNRKFTALRSPRPVDIESYKYVLEISGCTGNNLKSVHARIPLNRLVTVTGVSGSGKSTLVSQTFYPALAHRLGLEYEKSQPFTAMVGFEHVKNVLFIDQSPIGKTARSSPVTYLKIFDAIRNIMSSSSEARSRGYTPGTFSLNVDGGRCPVCKGLGFQIIDMVFMDDVKLLCDACEGRKFRGEVLDIVYRDKNIYQILNLTVAEAMDFFVSYPNIRKPLSFLKEVGLDYIRIGQAANTFSGGESQRLKIAREFISTQQKATLYILDEPTTGLHFREIEMLMGVLNKLVEGGGSVLLIEHNLDVIRSSDYVIDMGPEAGKNGGSITAEGSPEEIMKNKHSLTGRYLKDYLNGVANEKPVLKKASQPTMSK